MKNKSLCTFKRWCRANGFIYADPCSKPDLSPQARVHAILRDYVHTEGYTRYNNTGLVRMYTWGYCRDDGRPGASDIVAYKVLTP